MSAQRIPFRPIGSATLSFDGKSQYESIPNCNEINFSREQDFTITARISANPTQNQSFGEHSVMEKWDETGPYPFVIRYFSQGPDLGRILVAHYDGGTYPLIKSKTLFNDGKFHHVAFVRRTENGKGMLYLYIDGKLEGNHLDVTSGETQNNSPLYLGCRGSGTTGKYHFAGQIKDLEIYSVGLAQHEIAALAAQKPNLLLILADDLGVDALRIDDVTGHVTVALDGSDENARVPRRLPNLEKLLSSGLHFTRAWAHPTCSPTRGSLFTGLHPWKNGVGFPSPPGNDTLAMKPKSGKTIVSLAEALRGAGYRCGMFGKWDLGEPILTPPLAGFRPIGGETLSLDGKSQHRAITNSEEINFAREQDFTVASWIRAEPAQGERDADIIEKWDQNGPYPFVIRYINEGADLGKIVAARYDGTNNPGVRSTTLLNDSKFHHVTFVRRTENGKGVLYLYVDGKLEGSAPDTTTGNTENNSPLYLGCRGGFACFFAGQIRDLQIFHRGLTQTEVASISIKRTPLDWGWDRFEGFFEGGFRPVSNLHYGYSREQTEFRSMTLGTLDTKPAGYNAPLTALETSERTAENALVKSRCAEYLRAVAPDIGEKQPDIRYYVWKKSFEDRPTGVRLFARSPTERTHMYATRDQVYAAKSWIGQMLGAPWCVALTLATPHDPYHIPPAESYTIEFKDPANPTVHEMFVAMVESMDFYIGKLLNSEEPEIREQLRNTVIVFVTDNGTQDTNPDNRAQLLDKDKGDDKNSPYIGAVHVPMIIADGGSLLGCRPCYLSGAGDKAAVHGVCKDLVHIVDIYKTFTDIAGVEAPWAEDSQSLKPYLQSTSVAPRKYNFGQQYPKTDDRVTPKFASITDGTYKLSWIRRLSEIVDGGAKDGYDYAFSKLEPHDAAKGALKEAPIPDFRKDPALLAKAKELHAEMSKQRLDAGDIEDAQRAPLPFPPL
ncbi:LamG-like jellyroll fold domain-containing protein [Sorangium sp. So ce1151]|uniref:LamG-like jellyroll fold domain-containing protein n=1 Tax=Sorangium sp. So ce1151 TaxID=3133332 RepID=UPI003F5E714E